MKILIDIGHPAHIHYFKHAIKQLENKGHEFLITTRDKEIAVELLRAYGFNFICTGKNRGGVFNKIKGMARDTMAIIRAAIKFKPDVFFSFYSPFAAWAGWLMRKPVLAFADTEFAKLSIKITKSFNSYSFTPACFTTDLGRNHFRFKGYMETFYLHPDYFTPDENVVRSMGIEPYEPFFIMRFVSFTAGHDIGESGMDDQSKLQLAEYLSQKGKLFISSEGALPEHFERYRFKASPVDFHHLLAFATLYVGEGITTASECAHLGTPAILINSLTTGYIREEVNAGLICYLKTPAEALDNVRKILATKNLKQVYRFRRDRLLEKTIDCTAFLVWLLDNYPKSITTLRANVNSSYTISSSIFKGNEKVLSRLRPSD